MRLDKIVSQCNEFCAHDASFEGCKLMARVIRELVDYAHDLEDALDIEDDDVPVPSKDDLSDDTKEVLDSASKDRIGG